MNDETTTTAPATPAAAKPAKKAKAAPKAKGKQKKAAAKPAKNGVKVTAVKPGTKRETLYKLFTRKSGCTADECAKAVGWEAVSMTLQAKQMGLKLTTEKQKNGTTRYWGK